VASIIPFFRDRGFDIEATQALGKAYDIACRSLHPKGRAPTTQEFLAKKIIESAQYGERYPDRLAAIALSKLSAFHRDVTRRFGLVPNFFVSAPDAPEIVEKLWDFAKSAYLDNPIPSLFKELLFVFFRVSARCGAPITQLRDDIYLVDVIVRATDGRPEAAPYGTTLIRLRFPDRRAANGCARPRSIIQSPPPPTMAGATVKTGVDRNNLDEDSGWLRNFLQLLATDAHDLDAERASVAYYRSDNA
jgi:hypothetical protein